MRPYQEFTVEDEETGLRAYLVIQGTDKPISFGGTRVDASVTREMIVDLAENMSLKLAGHGSPVGGAKAGVRVAPEDPRLGRFLSLFAERCREPLSTTTILGKDMGAKQWMLDALYGRLGMPQLGIAQSSRRGGNCPDRISDLSGYVTHMTGKGVFWSIEQALGGAAADARVLIQGFGVVGAGVAWHVGQAGGQIVGVSDRDKAIVNGRGLDRETLLAARSDNGLLSEDQLGGVGVLVNRDDLLAQDADVLVLAAGSYVVDDQLAARIRAPVVVEAANLALTEVARHALHRKGIRVVPDVVANSSSAALVAHQIACANTLTVDALWADIERNIRERTEEVEVVSRRLGIESKTAFRLVVGHGREPEEVATRGGQCGGYRRP